MKKLQLQTAKWLLKRLGYRFVALKQTPIYNERGELLLKRNEVPVLFIEGDKELLTYVDVLGYFGKKDPIRRTYEVSPWPTPITRLSPEVLAEIEATTIPFPEDIKKQNETID